MTKLVPPLPDDTSSDELRSNRQLRRATDAFSRNIRHVFPKIQARGPRDLEAEGRAHDLVRRGTFSISGSSAAGSGCVFRHGANLYLVTTSQVSEDSADNFVFLGHELPNHGVGLKRLRIRDEAGPRWVTRKWNIAVVRLDVDVPTPLRLDHLSNSPRLAWSGGRVHSFGYPGEQLRARATPLRRAEVGASLASSPLGMFIADTRVSPGTGGPAYVVEDGRPVVLGVVVGVQPSKDSRAASVTPGGLRDMSPCGRELALVAPAQFVVEALAAAIGKGNETSRRSA